MKQGTKTLLLWGLLILMFFAIWQFLTPEPGAARPAPVQEQGSGAWLHTLIVAGAFLAFLLAMRRINAAAAAYNASIHGSWAHLEAGRYEEAERAVEAAAKSRLPQFRRAYHLQHAEIAARRGDREEALARVAPAIDAPEAPWFRGAQRKVAIAARGLRAFLRASAGDEAGARADIEAVRAASDVQPNTRARAALAEALVVEKSGDRAALRELLEKWRPLVVEAGGTRDRALWRALEAMSDASQASVYRQKGDRAAADDEAAAIAAWVARYAPNAAPFVRTGAPARADAEEASRAEEPSAAATRKVEAARPGKVKVPVNTTFAVWVVIILLFLGVWGASTYGGAPWMIAATVAGVGAFVAWIVRNYRRSKADARAINEALWALGEGDLDRAARELAREPKSAMHRAQRAHALAELDLRRGDMNAAIAHCDRSFTDLAEALGGKLTAPVAPAPGKEIGWDLLRLLAAQRAFALAGLGRADEAWAERSPGPRASPTRSPSSACASSRRSRAAPTRPRRASPPCAIRPCRSPRATRRSPISRASWAIPAPAPRSRPRACAPSCAAIASSPPSSPRSSPASPTPSRAPPPRPRPPAACARTPEIAAQKMKSVERKLDILPTTMSLTRALLSSFDAVATTVRIENARSASLTESVPSAESLRPVNGNVSGPRRHWLLRLMRDTWFTSASTRKAIFFRSRPNSATCCP
jgi:hypothetical protein